MAHHELKPSEFKRILVPIDFSALSRSAALYASKIAAQMKAEIILVTVVEVLQGNSTIMNWKKLEDQMMKDADEQCMRLINELKEFSPTVRVSYKTMIGSPIEEKILEFATSSNIDLIIMGTRGASGLKAVILGSNAAALINRSQVPVIAIPGDLKYQPFERIVLATDMVDLDKHVKEIVKFAKVFNAQVDILHISGTYHDQLPQGELERLLFEMTGYPRMTIHVVPSDDVTAGLNNYVIEHRADLLVMFTHELGLFEKLFGRGHTRKMAFHTEVPLLAIKRL